MPVAINENELSISSRHGLLRDLVPIYGLKQLLPNLLVLGFLLWLSHALGHLPTGAIIILMLGWVFQFVARPSVMVVSNEQADWLKDVLEEQGFYSLSEIDGRWRMHAGEWWRWSHYFIEFIPGDQVTVVAPREVMEALRASLEHLEEHGEVSFAQGGQPFEFEASNTDPPPWHTHIPTAVLGTACVLAWIWHLATRGLDGMIGWGVSATALAQGGFETIVLHMFAHGGAIHLVMNMSVLMAIGGTLTARLGRTPLNWLRFLLLYLLSGLAGAALYLALHPAGTVPMLGASGALYGVFGLLIRTPVAGGPVLAVKCTRIRRVGWALIKENVFLFALLALMSWSSGTAGGLAWEAHLGGFLFGLIVGPKLLPRSRTSPSQSAPVEGPV